jgi:osmotically inducible protein OsmC
MQFNRKATSVWLGTGKEGSGHLSTQSTVLNETQYSYNTRFADGIGTNPEELLAASHAGCFNMKLSFVLTGAGFPPEKLETVCTITLESAGITKSHLALTAAVPGISAEKFAECVEDAEKNCPISKLMNTTIVVDATLS